MTVSAEVTEAFQYADDVVAGRISVCRYVRLACERFLVEVQEAVDGKSPWEFKPELAARPIILTELLPNIKGPLAGQPIRLMAWPKFAIVNLFGFVERGTTTRRFRQGAIFVPRGNGKTSGIAPIALYLGVDPTLTLVANSMFTQCSYDIPPQAGWIGEASRTHSLLFACLIRGAANSPPVSMLGPGL